MRFLSTALPTKPVPQRITRCKGGALSAVVLARGWGVEAICEAWEANRNFDWPSKQPCALEGGREVFEGVGQASGRGRMRMLPSSITTNWPANRLGCVSNSASNRPGSSGR